MAKILAKSNFLIILIVFITYISAFRLVQDKSKPVKVRKSDLLKDEIERYLNKTVIQRKDIKIESKTSAVLEKNEGINIKTNEPINTKEVPKRKPNVESKIVTKSVTNQSDFNEMLKKIEEIKIKGAKPKILQEKLEKNITKPKIILEKKAETPLPKKKPKVEVKIVPKAKDNITEPISTVVKTLSKDDQLEKEKVREQKLSLTKKEPPTAETKTIPKNIKKDPPPQKVEQKLLPKVTTSDKLIKKPEPKVEVPKVEINKAEPKIEKPKAEHKKVETKVEKPKVEPKKPEIKPEKPKAEKKKVKPQKEVKKPELKVETKKSSPKESSSKVSPKQVSAEKSSKPLKKVGVNKGMLEIDGDISYVPDFSVVQNEECKKQGLLAIESFMNKKLWALKMFDSSAKLPSNILKGNLNQLGDFDQCLSVHGRIPLEEPTKENENVPMMRINGKYCIAYIDLEATEQEMKLPVNLAQGRAFIRSKNTDPGHFAPKFTTIKWGVCIPSACSHDDVEKILENVLPKNTTTGVRLHINVPAEECQVIGKRKIDEFHLMTFISIALIATLLSLTAVATVRDYIKEKHDEEDTSHQILMAFSLKRTAHDFLQDSKDEIPCIHGIRAICTILLYIAHKVIELGHSLYSNRVYLTEVANSPVSILLRMSVIYTDAFLLLSGVLTAYHMSKDMETKGYIPWMNRIFARIIRLSPILFIVLIYYAYIMEFTGDGPLWPSIINRNAELCKDSWWTNLLFIHNFYPFEEMCATHTHQLALDMQLFLIAPILVWLLYSKPFMGVVTTLLLHILSVVLRYYATVNYRLSLVIYHGISVTQLYRTANCLYASSIHRATPYLAGIGLGVLLRQLSPDARIPKAISIIGWLSAGYFIAWTLYTPSHLALRNYQYDISEAAQFSALCSLAWALALSWIIFASQVNLTGYLNHFLSSKPMVLLSKLSYTMYLTQFIVLFYNIGTIRTPSEFALFDLGNVAELTIVTIISLVTYLVVDSPTQKIKNILLKPSPKSKEEVKTKEKEAERKKEEEVVEEESVTKGKVDDNQQEFEDQEELTVTEEYDDDLEDIDELEDIEENEIEEMEDQIEEKEIEDQPEEKEIEELIHPEEMENIDEKELEHFTAKELEDFLKYEFKRPNLEEIEDKDRKSFEQIDYEEQEHDDIEEKEYEYEDKDLIDFEEKLESPTEYDEEGQEVFEEKENIETIDLEKDIHDDVEETEEFYTEKEYDKTNIEEKDIKNLKIEMPENVEEIEEHEEQVVQVKDKSKEKKPIGNNKPGTLPLMDEILDQELSEDEEEEE